MRSAARRVVSCRVLGPARVTIDGGAPPPELLWRKHLALLVYLARSPRRARTREHLLGLLWSDRDEKQARHSLSEALRVFRRALGDDQVEADVDQVRLGPNALVLDCDEFVARRDRGDWAGAAACVEGDFLEGLAVPGANEFENWLTAERAAWRSQSVAALLKSAEARLAGGDAEAAVPDARRALALDPASERAACAAMRALALAGDRAAALRVADELARTLQTELGTRPASDTLRLVERVREARVGRRVAAAPPAARPRPPLLGRGTELATLVDAWERARRSGRGQVVLVEGEPGEGKTRLVEELLARARLDDATVAAARAVPAEGEQAWSAVAGLLAGGLAEASGLAGAPPPALAALASLAPELGAGFRSSESGMSIGAALSAAVLAAAAERPVLLALDDAQWVDQATLRSLPALTRDVARARVMLVLGVARGSPEQARFDELRTRLGRDLEGAAVRVRRLDPAALRGLVEWGLPPYSAAEADRLARRIERDTAGIPALAVAMIEAVRQGFTLAHDAPAWPSPKRTLVDSLPGDLPPAVVGAVCVRFRTLPPAAQQVLGAAAALGGRVDAERLTQATGLDRASVERALDALEWDRWLMADARGYVFTALIERDILLQEMVTTGQVRRYRSGSMS
jgi:DNA-binding SARP family transcriptional activator